MGPLPKLSGERPILALRSGKQQSLATDPAINYSTLASQEIAYVLHQPSLVSSDQSLLIESNSSTKQPPPSF